MNDICNHCGNMVNKIPCPFCGNFNFHFFQSLPTEIQSTIFNLLPQATQAMARNTCRDCYQLIPWWRCEHTFKDSYYEITCATFLDNNTVVIGTHDGAAMFWDLNTYTCKRSLSYHATKITCLAVSGDAKTLAIGDAGGRVVVCDANTDACRSTITTHNNPIIGLALMPNGNTIGIESMDGIFSLWDLNTGTKGISPKTTPRPTKICLANSNDLTLSVIRSSDGMIKVCNTHNGVCISTLGNLLGPIEWLAISNDGKTLVASNPQDGVTRIWKLNTQPQIQPPIQKQEKKQMEKCRLM